MRQGGLEEEEHKTREDKLHGASKSKELARDVLPLTSTLFVAVLLNHANSSCALPSRPLFQVYEL